MWIVNVSCEIYVSILGVNAHYSDLATGVDPALINIWVCGKIQAKQYKSSQNL